MTEKCFKAIGKEIWKDNRIWCVGGGEHCADVIATAMNELIKENEQLTQQLQIFEKFLEGNDLSIDWEEFCGLNECAFENPNFSCKTCIHLKGDV